MYSVSVYLSLSLFLKLFFGGEFLYCNFLQFLTFVLLTQVTILVFCCLLACSLFVFSPFWFPSSYRAMQLLLGWHPDLSSVGVQNLFTLPRERAFLATCMSLLMRQHVSQVGTSFQSACSWL
jgi:hypothetical protein